MKPENQVNYQYVYIAPESRQLYHRLLARAVTSIHQNPYFRLEAYVKLFSYLGKDAVTILKAEFGDGWRQLYSQMMKTYEHAYEWKFYFDALTMREISRKDMNNPMFLAAKKAARKIPLMMPKIERMHVVLLNHSALKDMTINPQIFSEERRKYNVASRTYEYVED